MVIASYPNREYSKYDLLDLSELQVQVNDNEVYTDITDYTLTWEDNGKKAVDQEMLLFEEGRHNLIVSKTGLESLSFSVRIWGSTNFKQTLSITSQPDKTTYSIGDAFSSDGIAVTLKTTYVNADNVTTRRTEEVSSQCSFLVDEEPLTSQTTFSASGSKQVTVIYDNDEDISTSFYIFVRNGITGPTTYPDDSMTTVQDDTTITLTIKNETVGTTGKTDEYYSPDQVVNNFTISDYGRNNYINWNYTPTTGDVPMLVVPVVVPGYESMATENNLDLIERAFFGKSKDLYFESLRSYYYKASYGALNFTGAITDYLYPGAYDTAFSKISGFTESSISNLAVLAANWAEEVAGYDLSKFDSDNDGLIDGMWMIYMGPTNSNSCFWAFSTTTMASGVVGAPVVNNFGWAGISFLNDTVYGTGSYDNKNCDAHVLIHETGHMLGLNDYYSYGVNSYNPVGLYDMMSYNVGDHSPYSKLLYGWVKPYIVYGNATITIKSCQWKDTMVIIPYDDKVIKTDDDGKAIFNSFDEYLVVDYYTNQNLYSQGFDAYGVSSVNAKAGRIYHVDNRLCYYNNSTPVFYDDPDDALTDTEHALAKIISNSESGSRAESTGYGADPSFDPYDEIRLISADKRFLSSTSVVSSKSFFATGSSFSLASYSSQFPNESVFNNEKYCSYTINF